MAATLREGLLLPVLAVLAVVAGPALAHVAPRGPGPVHARRDVLAGVQVAHVHTLPSEVPCGDRPASPPPQNLPTTLLVPTPEPEPREKMSQAVCIFPTLCSPCHAATEGRGGDARCHGTHQRAVGRTWKCSDEGFPGPPPPRGQEA